MSMRPEVPASIRGLKAPTNFVNPFQIGIAGPNLFGTETLCGDWNAEILLLAQDFAPAAEVRAVLLRHGPAGAWRHNDGDDRYRIGLTTNLNICYHLGQIGRKVDIKGRNAENCGVLYGNASFFLKEGNTSPAKGVAASAPIFQFVIANMPKLKVVVCLGKPAFEGMMGWLGLSAKWRFQLDERRPLRHGYLLIFAMAHPGQLGINGRLIGASNAERLAAIDADWEAVERVLH